MMSPHMAETGHPQDHAGLTRRDFIRNAAVGAGVGLALGQRTASAQETAGPKAKVVLVRDEKVLNERHRADPERVEAMLTQAMQALTGESDVTSAWGHFVKPTDVVGVKANVMITPTNPELLRVMLRQLVAVGVPEENLYTWDRAQYAVGFDGADRRKRTRTASFDSRRYCKLATETCTVLLNVPGTKVHRVSGVGIAVKNWVGGMHPEELPITGNPEAVFYQLHQDSCADLAKLAWIPEIRKKCTLNIVEAFRPLFHGGPQVDPKYVWHYNGLFVSTDPVAVDIVIAKMLRAKRDEYRGEPWPIEPPIKHLMIADTKYNLGTSDLSRIEVVKLGDQEGVLL